MVQEDTAQIAKTDASELMQLKNSIERDTLRCLIEKYEDMLPKDLTEAKWQEFFKSNPFILNLAYSHPIFLVQDQAYVGGASLRGVGEKIADFLVAQSYTGNLGLIEIKRPKTPLLHRKEYRVGLYSPSKELSGAICQVLNQRFRLQTNFTQKAYEHGLQDVHPYAIHCIVIAGTSPENRNEGKSLELFRGTLKDVLIVTFDELLEKLKGISSVFEGAEQRNTATESDNTMQS